jgi:hypothetical protein
VDLQRRADCWSEMEMERRMCCSSHCIGFRGVMHLVVTGGVQRSNDDRYFGMAGGCINRTSGQEYYWFLA